MITDCDYLPAIAPWLCTALQRDVNGKKKQKEKKQIPPYRVCCLIKTNVECGDKEKKLKGKK